MTVSSSSSLSYWCYWCSNYHHHYYGDDDDVGVVVKHLSDMMMAMEVVRVVGDDARHGS